MTKDEIAPYRDYIESALSYGGGTHSFDDVCALVEADKAQFWPGPHSAVVTEIIDYPQHRTVHCWLAGGNLAELEAMYPLILEWAKALGCARASFTGRRGWERTFLTRMGWEPTLVVFEKSL